MMPDAGVVIHTLICLREKGPDVFGIKVTFWRDNNKVWFITQRKKQLTGQGVSFHLMDHYWSRQGGASEDIYRWFAILCRQVKARQVVKTDGVAVVDVLLFTAWGNLYHIAVGSKGFSRERYGLYQLYLFHVIFPSRRNRLIPPSGMIFSRMWVTGPMSLT